MKELDCFNIKKGYYLITENGKIYSKLYNKFLSDRIAKDGYPSILLVCEDGRRRHFRINRLVAGTYIENPNNYSIVLHLDNNPLNNDYSNLKWGTVSENTQQAYNDNLCSCNKKVYLYDLNEILIKEFTSISELARYFGYTRGNITNLGAICRGEKPQYTKGRLKDFIITHERL